MAAPDARAMIGRDAWARARALAAAARAGEGVAEEIARTPRSGAALLVCYLDLIEAMAREVGASGRFAIAQTGQTLDGRIATAAGHAHYVNGPEALDHLHRLRALVDAVVVGVATVAHDDPQLTTRRVEGADPVRVVLDPRGRTPPSAKVCDGSARTILVVGAAGAPAAARPNVETIVVATDADGLFPPQAALDALAARGLRAVLVEGGGRTVSRFLAGDALDRLHLLIAPTILGSGTPSFTLPAVARIDEARRLALQADPYRLGADLLLDCRPLRR